MVTTNPRWHMRILNLFLLLGVLGFAACNSKKDTDSTTESLKFLAEDIYLPETYFRDPGVKLIRVPNKLLILSKTQDTTINRILSKLDDPNAASLIGKELVPYLSLSGTVLNLSKDYSMKDLNRIQSQNIGTNYIMPAYIGEGRSGPEFEFFPLPQVMAVDSTLLPEKQRDLKGVGLIAAPDSLQSLRGFLLMQVTEGNAFIVRQKLINRWSASLPEAPSYLRLINVPVMIPEESPVAVPDIVCNPSNWNLSSIGCGTFCLGSVRVAVLDYGFNIHSSLNLATGYNLVDGSTNITSPYSNHGLRVSGVIGSRYPDALGVAQGVEIIPLALGTTPPSELQLTSGIKKALARRARVLNMSIGVFAGPDIENAALDYKLVDPAIESAEASGLLMVASAGNFGTPTLGIKYPACNPLVMAIGAIDRQNQWLSNSCYRDFMYNGKLSGISVVAPGDEMEALAIPTTVCRPGGTSYAAAQVSGLAAILFSRKPTLSNRQVRKIIESTADELTSYPPTSTSGRPRSSKVGYGKINIRKAVQAL